MIKASQIYGWDEEPVDERPSEFMSTTTYMTLSGYHPMNDPRRQTRARRGVIGLKSMVAFCVVLLSGGVYALIKLAPLLHGA